MTLASQYLLYLMAFRLGIISAGVISILLGYRLFARGIFGVESGKQATSVEAKIANSGFTLKNAAPGTGFGLFGVILITTMMVQGSPEFAYETLKNAPAENSSANPTKLTMRGDEAPSKFAALTEEGISYERAGDYSRAIDAYRDALTAETVPMNQLAWLYFKQGKLDDALPPARLAATLNPNNAAILDTLAEILAKQGNRAEAEKWMEKAAALDPRYRQRFGMQK